MFIRDDGENDDGVAAGAARNGDYDGDYDDNDDGGNNDDTYAQIVCMAPMGLVTEWGGVLRFRGDAQN